MSESFVSVTNGPVQAGGGTYLPRKADEDLYRTCQAGKFSYVLASRQIGKSSLMFETAEKLRQAGFKVAVIDLNIIGHPENADSWFFSLVKELSDRLTLDVDVQAWWKGRADLSAPTQRFLEFLRDVVLKRISDRIVIFIDEIDTTLGLGYTDDFFAAIRAVYHDRAQYSDYKRLTFVLLGVATPDELIRDNTRTPFNIGQAINLGDFTKQEFEPLRLAIQAKYPRQGRHYFDQIYEWTNGHPYLTQKLGAALLNTEVPALPKADTDIVDSLVVRLFLAPEDRGDNNLEFVQSRVGTDPYVRGMLNTYGRLLNKEIVADDEQSLAINRLKLYGLVVVQGGKLEVRNNLYARVFNLEWVEGMLKNFTKKLGLPSRYRIIQQIGSGACSTVYLAEETQESSQKKRSVALKVLQLPEIPETLLEEIIKRFKQEAGTLARLNHRNIITTFETNQSETGRNYEQALYIAMEYISGGSLRQRLNEKIRLPREQAVDIIRQVGGALSHAHEQGIIHRDVNPNNILLDTSQETLRPVLTDFSLIKLLSQHQSAPIRSTGPVGTVQYMAPEQFSEDLLPTPTLDVYALAITLFEMLAGQRPVKQVGKTTIPLLSSVISEMGPFFDDVLIKATAEKSADRYQSITEFIEAVETVNEQAREQEEKRKRAALAVQAARSYAQTKRFGTALKLIEPVLEDYPGYVEALRLRGEIERHQSEYAKALATYEQAYQQERNPDSEAGRDYLNLLREMATTAWQHKKYQDALEQYKIIRHLRNEGCQAGFPVEIWDKTTAELVSDHQKQGATAFALGNPDNLAEALTILGRQIEALKVLDAPEEIQDLENKLKLLQIKRSTDEGEAAYANGAPDNIDRAIQLLQGKVKQLDELNATSDSQKLEHKLRDLKIKQQLKLGIEKYNQFNPDNLIEVTQFLEAKIKTLEELGAAAESQKLKEKKLSLENTLQIQEYRDIIQAEEALIIKDNIQDEAIFQHYHRIDEVYQILIRLQSDNKQWQTERCQNLKKEAVCRRELAKRALGQTDHDTAIRHYRHIQEIAQKYDELTQEPGGLTQELGLDDLPGIISGLIKKSDRYSKYQKIKTLTGAKNYPEALKRLNEDFIQTGDYEYSDVARLLWGIVYANQHEGQDPPEWEANASLKNLEGKYNRLNIKLNAYEILAPVAMLGVMILGVGIGYSIQNLPEIPIVIQFAFVLTIVYFFWYIWVHYGSKIHS